MDKRSVIKFSAIVAAFVLLIVGYVYFNEQSLLASGKSNADLVVGSIQDGDVASVKNRLDEFVGGPSVEPEYEQAITSLNYVAGLVETGEKLTFSNDALSSTGDYRIYAASYEITAPQGGQDYLIVTMRRQESSWVLSNLQLAAVDLLGEQD